MDKASDAKDSVEDVAKNAKTTAKKAPAKAKSEKTTAKPVRQAQGKQKKDKLSLKDTSGMAAKVIVKPLQTEKIAELMVLNQYVFEVTEKATKNEVKKAIKAMYNVDAEKVRVINVRGKQVRFGRTFSKRKNWRKAIVKLKAGDKIEVFEGV